MINFLRQGRLKLSLILLLYFILKMPTGYTSSGQYFSAFTFSNPADLVFFLQPNIDPKTGKNFFHHQQITIEQENLWFNTTFTGLSGPITLPTLGSVTSHNYIPLVSAGYVARFSNKVAFGLNIGHPIVDETVYPRHSFYRFSSIKSIFHAMDVAPSLAYLINQAIAIGFGIDIESFHVELENAIPPNPPLPETIFNNSLDDTSVGWHAGLLIHPFIGTFIDLVYYSPIHFGLTGLSSVTGLPLTIASAKATLPSITRFSVFQALSHQFGLSGEIDYTQWSALQTVNINNTPFGPVTLIFKYRNTWRFNLAGRYAQGPWILYVDASYDMTPTTPNTQFLTDEKNYFSSGFEVERTLTKHLIVGTYYFHSFFGKVRVNRTAPPVITNGIARPLGDEVGIFLTVMTT